LPVYRLILNKSLLNGDDLDLDQHMSKLDIKPYQQAGAAAGEEEGQ
jgi:hypothetical protein